jgi:para-nitrobenzyl esterase
LSLVINNRKREIDLADRKVVQQAPVYLAWFGWNPPIFDGRLRAFYTMDIAFCFYNTDVQISHTGGGARPWSLATKMSGSLVQFMKAGDPNGGGLPQ